MRLESLCTLSMQYRGASWHRPYGTNADGEEGLGFGHGDGVATGEIEGSLVWANFPRRREDGVWTPNLRGMITTPDGNELLVSIHGQSVEEEAGGRRAILARVELTADEQALFERQLSEFLAYARQVQDVVTTDVPPTSHPTGASSALRDDVVRPSLDRDTVLAQAPDADARAGLFKVPRVFGG